MGIFGFKVKDDDDRFKRALWPVWLIASSLEGIVMLIAAGSKVGSAIRYRVIGVEEPQSPQGGELSPAADGELREKGEN